MKNPIEWHEECLKNMIITAKGRTAVSARALAEEKRIWGDVRVLQDQIEMAKSKGKDGFDADRFMRKVGLKSW